MAVPALQLINQAKAAHRDQRFREALTILDRHWQELHDYAAQCDQAQELSRLRQECRDRVIDRQRDTTITNMAASRSKAKRRDRKLRSRRGH